MRCIVGLAPLALLPLVAGCGLDQAFSGSGDGGSPVAGAPAVLLFLDQPEPGQALIPLPAVRVAVHDDQGNLVTSFAGLVSLAVDSNPAGATLSDSTTVAAAHGIATFHHLLIDKAGVRYRLVATAPATSLVPVRSLPFDVLAPPTGALTVTTTTTGSGFPSGYSISVDSLHQAIGVNATLTFLGVVAGTHAVGLTGLTAECSVSGANPVTVTVAAGGNAQATFAVSCTAPPPPPPPPDTGTGALTVTTTTSGSNLPAGYSVTLDGSRTAQIGVNDSVTANGIAAGSHSLLLSGVPANCTVGGANPLTLTITAGATTTATFAVTCS
jgi:hypothetical protein